MKGQAASTTGNITGIYDMNGGAYDRVMGVYNRTVGSSGINFSTLNAKYYDNYTTTNATTSCNQGVCYGHALSETIGWYNDYDSFVDSSNAWFFRDGGYGNTSVADVFFFCGNNGDASSAYSFRIVLSRAQ